MMPFLITQTKLLNSIANFLYNEVDDSYDSLSCEFTIFGEGATKTASSSIAIFRAGHEESRGFSDMALLEVTDVVVELHTLMKAHTGGEWTSFTLTLDANGKAHTKFHYPDDPA